MQNRKVPIIFNDRYSTLRFTVYPRFMVELLTWKLPVMSNEKWKKNKELICQITRLFLNLFSIESASHVFALSIAVQIMIQSLCSEKRGSLMEKPNSIFLFKQTLNTIFLTIQLFDFKPRPTGLYNTNVNLKENNYFT